MVATEEDVSLSPAQISLRSVFSVLDALERGFMKIFTTGKQIDLGESLRSHVEAHTKESVGKYFDNPIRSEVVFARESRLFCVDVAVNVGHNLSFQARSHAAEPYVAFDLALGRISKQMRRRKRKLRNHRSGARTRRAHAMTGSSPATAQRDVRRS